MTITGTVTEYQFRNPHIFITVAVKNADGSTSWIEVEVVAASVLGRAVSQKTPWLSAKL